MEAHTQSNTLSTIVSDGSRDLELDADRASPPALAFEAGFAHDLRNLIQIASATFNRLARNPTISASDALGPVVAGGALALHKAGQMLGERIHGSRLAQLAEVGTDVRECLRELEMIVRSTWEPGSYRIELCLDPEIPPACCDRQALQDAMLNLVLNARDAMPDGGTIMVEAFAVICGNEPMIRLRVVDHGIGMTEQTLQSAFEPFFTTKAMGLGGVGLPMVRHFVEGSGGTLQLESAVAKGTIVTLQLPGVRQPTVAGD